MTVADHKATLQTLQGQAHLQGEEALELVWQVVREWKDKFDIEEVNSALVLRTAALEYAKAYTGEFAYMISMRAQAQADNWLSPAQCKGVLNCMRAEAARNKNAGKSGESQEFVRQPDVIGLWGIKPRAGIFTIVFDEETDDRITLRLKKAPEFMTVKPGTLIASYLYGQDNESSYKGFAFIQPDNKAFLWKAFRNTDDEEHVSRLVHALEVQMSMDEHHRMKAGEAYSLESGSCCICGKTLTVPVSISRGIGPDCWKRLKLEIDFDEELSQEAAY